MEGAMSFILLIQKVNFSEALSITVTCKFMQILRSKLAITTITVLFCSYTDIA